MEMNRPQELENTKFKVVAFRQIRTQAESPVEIDSPCHTRQEIFNDVSGRERILRRAVEADLDAV
jgi:hypothetical protein